MNEKSRIPSVSELFSSYLARTAEKQRVGFENAAATTEMQLYDAAPAQPPSPFAAWEESVSVLNFFQCRTEISQQIAPEGWTEFVARQEPRAAVPFALGNYPQLVRNLSALIQTDDLATLLPRGFGVTKSPKPVLRVRQNEIGKRLASFVEQRVANDLNTAEAELRLLQQSAPESWQDFLKNEQAALAWDFGRYDEAATLWQNQTQSIPVLFNQGIAALFTGSTQRAQPLLRGAIAQIPTVSGWRHLGSLYLSIAESR